MQTHLRRGLAALATGALVSGLAVAVSTPSQAAPATDPAPARAAAAWLTSNLNSDSLVESHTEWEGQVFSGPSYGTSVDLAEGLARIPGQSATVSRITDAVAKNLAAYTTYEDAFYSGSAAKALALLASQGRGTTQLRADVEKSVVTTAGPARGRLQDSDPTPDQYWTDYANSIGQAYAARALTQLGSPLAGTVVDYLLAQQCSAGFFRLYFPAVGTADQTCDGASPAEPAAQSADTTAIAIIQMAPLAAGDVEVRAALTRAVAWLKTQQKADGSFVDPVNGANTNTTGLAGWALGEAGEVEAAGRAATWLRERQVVGACAPSRLAGEHGAVAYDDQGWKDGVQYGITDKLDRSQWVIADVQALPALTWAPAATKKDAVVLPKFARAGKKVTATVQGLAPGERACVSGSAGAKDLVGTGKDVKVAITRAKAGKRTVSLRTATGKVSDTVRVLGQKRLAVKVAKSARAGSKKVVTVKGLAAGEKVTLKVRGKKVATGKASKKGTFKRKVKVGKRGSAKVTVTGQYATRKGAAKIRVR